MIPNVTSIELIFLYWVVLLKTEDSFHFIGDQELKIEGEQQEMMEEDDLDLMLPAKKKKQKKVEFVEESDTVEKDDGMKTHLI